MTSIRDSIELQRHTCLEVPVHQDCQVKWDDDTSCPGDTDTNESDEEPEFELDELQRSSWYKNWIIELEESTKEWQNRKLLKDAEAAYEPVHIPFSKGKWRKRLHSLDIGRKEKIGIFGDIWTIVETYCEDWEDSPFDIATFFICLVAFSRPPNVMHDIVFDAQLILDAYYFSQFAFAAYGVSTKKLKKRLPFLHADDFIDASKEDTLGDSPAWYLAVDRDQEYLVLGLRGTFGFNDILVDLCAQFVPWKGGHVHQGFLRALKTLVPQVLVTIAKFMQNNPTYQLRIVGHSMGAAVGALLTIMWYQDFPEWNVRGYGFATPCCVSASLSRESQDIFTTFVHQFDAVARLSLGSIQDLHNGMRVFVSHLGRKHNSLAILRAVQYKMTGNLTDKVRALGEKIDQVIDENVAQQLCDSENPSHLFPAGRTFQLWREKRGHRFHTWQMYQSTLSDYGRLWFTPSMLKDHVTAKYSGAFENMLSVSVMERHLWLNLPKSRRQAVREYWDSVSENAVTCESVDSTINVSEMKRTSRWKRRAFEMGLIRPFLLLVSMSPRRRAAIAEYMGVSLVKVWWYREFDSHHEAWYLLTHKFKGIQPRSARIVRKVNPFAHANNWWMILYRVGKFISRSQSHYIPKEVRDMLKEEKRFFYSSIEACREPHNCDISRMEEILLLMFVSLTDCLVHFKPDHMPDYERDEDRVDEAELMRRSQHQTKCERNEYCDDPVYKETMQLLRERGYTVEVLMHKLAVHRVQTSGPKKINEIFAYGAELGKRAEHHKIHGVALLGGLSLASGIVIVGGGALVALQPGLAVVPIVLLLGGLLFAMKSNPSALISAIVGCLSQRIALLLKGLCIDDYYE